MKFTLAWLKDHLETTATLAEIETGLTAIGLEVEGIEDPSKHLGGFVVGHVLEADKHPDADKLKLCKVDTGATVIQVVCGAPNARVGLKVILAQPGTYIPHNGEILKKGKVRGVESQGMMCSWRELKLGEDHDGIAELAADAEVGAKLLDIMSFDPMIEISVTPNRVDCLGVRGIARDLAAFGLGSLKPLKVEPVPGTFKSPIGVRLDFSAEDLPACPLFAGRHIRGVKNGESPQWLKDRLTAIGLRPISTLVDITNFFTYDLCRPLHVFDVAKVKGDIRARLAKTGESLVALNGKTYALDESMTVIADEAGPEALAGIMGAEHSGCTEATTEVFLEAAYFDPIRTAATGRRLEILSDARFRFERGVDPAFVVPAMELATRMILDLCGGEASEAVIAGTEPDWQKSIVLRPERVAELGGVEVPVVRMEAILNDLGCAVAEHADGLLVNPPSWRGDITAEHDLVEEVIRINGYDNIPSVPLPRLPMPKPILTPSQRRSGWVRRQLASRGLVETVTWSFLPEAQAKLFGGGQADMHLANPISSDLDVMRPSVLPNLITAAGRNADRGMRDLGLFEIGPQFDGPEPGQQRQMAAGIRAGKARGRHWAEPVRAVDAFDAKSDLVAAIAAAGGNPDSFQVVAEAPAWYHPGRSGSLKLGNKPVAFFGEIHPGILNSLDVKGPVVGFELFLEALPPAKAKATKARTLLKASPFQPLERDFAFILDSSVAADAVVRAAKGADKVLVSEVAVFDLYEGDRMAAGKKSLAITVTLQPTEKTLTDEEIEAVAARIVQAVAKATGGELRG
ncbi:phenylalanine--tRNA ligase subunit beta [Paramagnetospirillum kuznetsovii]|uniref:Phenylalanine--tRNA ligase beta subunit n=1 Tax=Paramagnetospirillum kuznetsovii TaxID=2053833 RepID=A0A364NXD3_9PROT|nr:phenylalanine--tRNA ligase subunit beta [Paramagnetospirillum kuznetsovii]RAU21640.1 phenylalanine--tRNA ligase subunit beta [Paramagnetospirillum kuznetsovii]